MSNHVGAQVFLIIPGAELLLPVALTLSPGMILLPVNDTNIQHGLCPEDESLGSWKWS